MHRIWWVFAVIIFLTSCNDRLVFSEYAALSNGNWKKGDTIGFQWQVKDTTSGHHIFLNVRNNNDYAFSNLFLILEMEAPDGTATLDTLEYEMALPNGQWLGRGHGSIKESKLWYRENINFDDSGVYTLKLLHAMRKNGEVDGLEDLKGITDVGVQIEKSSN